MQFPVPQFTDVEDKIIASLTIKQFGIIFGAGVLVFLAYTATKSIAVMIFFILFVGLPALAVAFGKINGRPVYTSFGFVLKFILEPKVLVFHKESRNFADSTKVKDVEVAKVAVQVEATKQNTRQRLQEVQKLLEKQAEQEKALAGEIK